jgi:hydrogenase/urease accessory protein HupE
MKRLLFLALLATNAFAHEIATTRVTAKVADGHCTIDIRADTSILLNRLEIRAGLPRSHRLAPEELQKRIEASAIAGACELAFDGRRVPLHLDRVDAGGVTLSASAPESARLLTWSYALASGTYPLTLEIGTKPHVERVWIDATQRSAPVDVTAARPPRRIDTARTYLLLGFTHIVPNGLDHILFVLGIFLLSVKVRDVLSQVTAFTIAHSITLALTMYGIVSLPSRIVEPAIAISIVYVAIENLAVKAIRPSRVAVVFCFGLLHGMGFAGVLRELGLPRSQFGTALVSFNCGVELGQLAVIGTAWLLVASWARSQQWYRWRVIVPASLAIAATGAFWAVQRMA